MTSLRQITDGVLFQAVLTGSLSFSHIHDLAAAHGQAGWKAWLYPLSVDLLTVAAYRKLMAARRTHAPVFLAWCAFLLGLEASLAANIISAWQNPDRFIAVALGVWPAVAFLVCTLLSHDPAPRPEVTPDPAPAPVAVPAASTSALVSLDPAPAPAPTQPPSPPVVPAPAAPAPVASPVPVPALAEVSPAFLEHARRIADEHHAAHGSPIDFPTLRARLRVNEPLARAVHNHLMTQPVGA
jgi:hypothetical protein